MQNYHPQTPYLKLETQDGLTILTLSDPKTRNAITNFELIADIKRLCVQLKNDPSAKVLIITGQDPVFSSGGNIKEMSARKGMFAGSPEELKDNYKKGIQSLTKAIYFLEIPTIAAINGPAIGAGLDLALTCDFRLASTKAILAESFINVGLIPGDGGAYLLSRIVGQAKALELALTGSRLTAHEALDIGLVSQVVDHDQLLEKTKKLAQTILKKSGPALRLTKKLFRKAERASLETILDLSAQYQAQCHFSPEHSAALQTLLNPKTSK